VPIYEFTCRDCETRFEELVKANGADPHVDCPSCGSADTLRLLSAFSVRSAAADAAPAAAPVARGGGCCGGACGCG
jgi:putative FmdB family regulatory protein